MDAHLAKLLGLRGSFFIIPLYSGVRVSTHVTDTSAILSGQTAHTFPEILYSSAESYFGLKPERFQAGKRRQRSFRSLNRTELFLHDRRLIQGHHVECCHNGSNMRYLIFPNFLFVSLLTVD